MASMRPRTILLMITCIGFLAASIGTAVAQDNTNTTDDTSANPGNDRAATHRAAAEERRAELKAAREAVLSAFHDARKAAIADYHAALNATRASYLENKTLVLEACHNKEEDADAEKHCVRDGLKPLIEKARAEIKDARDTFRADMTASKMGGMKQFANEKAKIEQRHGRPARG